MSNPSNPIDLGQLFQTVMGTLAQNKESLNNADINNHDHGDNMVNTFQLITRAINEKKGANPSEQLAYAAEILRQQKSGSAQLYAKGLSQASQQFQGQEVNSDNAMTLIPTLLGIGNAPVQQSTYIMTSPADGAYVSGTSINFQWKAFPGATKYWLIVRRVKDGSPRINKDLGNVLSSDEHGFGNDGTQYKWTVGVGDNPESDAAAAYLNFTNGLPPQPQEPQQQQAQQQQQDAGINDIIGTLIRKAQNKPQGQQQQDAGINDIIGTLISKAQNKPQGQQQQDAGVNDIIGSLIRKAQQPQARQQSKSSSGVNLDTIVNGLVSNSSMGGSYRSQSGSLVANALITAVQSMVNKK
ncbi:MAG: hypothetical protein NTY79_01750 [Chloroflexi bacterium]|nr:hypothetical protein [Chloroflexota bacterium]